jgi:hypothetical protein
VQDLLGIGMVIGGVALHQVPAHEEYSEVRQ